MGVSKPEIVQLPCLDQFAPPTGSWVVYSPRFGWWEGGQCYSRLQSHAARFYSREAAERAYKGWHKSRAAHVYAVET